MKIFVRLNVKKNVLIMQGLLVVLPIVPQQKFINPCERLAQLWNKSYDANAANNHEEHARLREEAKKWDKLCDDHRAAQKKKGFLPRQWPQTGFNKAKEWRQTVQESIQSAYQRAKSRAKSLFHKKEGVRE